MYHVVTALSPDADPDSCERGIAVRRRAHAIQLQPTTRRKSRLIVTSAAEEAAQFADDVDPMFGWHALQRINEDGCAADGSDEAGREDRGVYVH
ncbi:hypothetical protein [Nocardia sp. CS682]|uniref:hypothetical protein n=1 Tax=Nocardia sp. CS682 TaxID=1047172 RepID=UPI00143225D5|nr:hypothetical protein [Nocardia sp. CS682]